MLGVLVINSTCKDKRNSGNHDITMFLRPKWEACREGGGSILFYGTAEKHENFSVK